MSPPVALFDRICVSPPYRAFEALKYHEEGTVSGFVLPQHPLGHEAGPICGAEAGRHLAILGSCAAAFANARPGKHYYLAVEALLTRELPGAACPIPGEPLLGLATCAGVGKREAKASATLEARVGDGSRIATVYSLAVRYNVLGEEVFLRLFRNREMPREDGIGNPYAAIALPRVASRTLGSAESEPELVAANACPGHFAAFRALPVAVVMQKLSGLAADLLTSHPEHGVRRCVVQSAKVSASNLAWAGESVRYSVRFVDREGPDFRFQGMATTVGGVDVGEIGLVLRAG